MPNRYFADISDYQTTFDAKAYRRAGHLLIAIKASEGQGAGGAHQYPERVHAAHQAGLAVLHYHFGHPDNHLHGTDEANYFASRVKGKLGPNDGLVLDLEVPSGRAQAYAGEFEQALKRHFPKRPLVVYSYASYIAEHHLYAKRLWVASYSGKIERLVLPFPQGHWAHQFTDGKVGAEPHQVAGIGHCDVSRLNMRSYLRLRARRK